MSCFHDQLSDKLIELSQTYLENCSSVLEIGSHNGRLTHKLRKRYPSFNLVTLDQQTPKQMNHESFVCADAEKLPIKPQVFDAIVSGGTFQWFKHEWFALNQLADSLKPGGVICFSQFIKGSMTPFASVMKEMNQTQRLLPLKTEIEVSGNIDQSIWDCLVWEGLEGMDNFGSMGEQLRFLRNIGATQAQKKEPFYSSQYRELCDKMENYRENQSLPLKWKAMLVVLRKKD